MEVKEVSVGPNRMTVIKKYGGPSGGAYGLGFLGAFVYYLKVTTGFSAGVFGFIKAIVWPAILVYHLFNFLKL